MATSTLTLAEPRNEVRRWPVAHLWVGYLVAMTAVTLAYLLVPAINSGPVFNIIGISAVVAILVGIRVNRIEHPLPWYLFACAQAIFVTGDILAYNYRAIFGQSLPFPSIADVFYLLFYPVLVAGILLLIRGRSPGRDIAGLIDSLIIAIGCGVLSWVFLMAPYAHDHSLSLPTKLTSIAYPLMDILVLTVVARLTVTGGKRERSFTLLLMGAVSLLVADSVYGWLELHGGYTTGGLLDGGWAMFYLLLGAAALHPSSASLARRRRTEASKLTRARLAVLTLAALAAPAVQVDASLADKNIDVTFVAGAGAVLYVLVLARLAGLTRKQKQSEARFSSLVRNSSDVVTVIDADLRIRYMSPSVERLFGHSSAALEGTNFAELIRPQDELPVRQFLETLAESGGLTPALIEFAIRHQAGNWLEVETLATCLLDDPTVLGIVLNTRDVSERKAFERQLQRHAFYDEVTGLANRALFTARVEQALEEVQRTRESVAVIFMDIDDFKIVNDTFGHAAGDALLREVGDRLRACLRTTQTPARLGGDEFAVLLKEADSGVAASEVAERIRIVLEPPFRVEGNEFNVRASLGIAFSDGSGAEASDELLRNADVAMYMAKGQGKSRCEIYRPTMHKTIIERLGLKGDLRDALARNELVLHYQPLVTLETGVVSGFEALVRWQHPRRGLIPPCDFIPLAEETGLIIPIGNWVLETACRELKQLQSKFEQDPPLTMSVNVSSRQLQWAGLVASVKRTLDESSLDPKTLTLEVTESVMMQDIDLAVLRLAGLRRAGVRIAIDDFGAGYSSLGYIRRLPIDILKVDKSFIDRVDEGEEERVLTGAIIDIAKALNLTPIAEGVERQGQLDQLLQLGCNSAQGFYFAKPATGEMVEQRLSGLKIVAA